MGIMWMWDPIFLPYEVVPQLLLKIHAALLRPCRSLGVTPLLLSLPSETLFPYLEEGGTMGRKIVRKIRRARLIRLPTSMTMFLTWRGNSPDLGAMLPPLQLWLWPQLTKWQRWSPWSPRPRLQLFLSLFHPQYSTHTLSLTLLICTSPHTWTYYAEIRWINANLTRVQWVWCISYPLVRCIGK